MNFSTKKRTLSLSVESGEPKKKRKRRKKKRKNKTVGSIFPSAKEQNFIESCRAKAINLNLVLSGHYKDSSLFTIFLNKKPCAHVRLSPVEHISISEEKGPNNHIIIYKIFRWDCLPFFCKNKYTGKWSSTHVRIDWKFIACQGDRVLMPNQKEGSSILLVTGMECKEGIFIPSYNPLIKKETPTTLKSSSGLKLK